jgi:hypothetical protein
MQSYSCKSALRSWRDVLEYTFKQEVIMEIVRIPGIFVGSFALGAALIFCGFHMMHEVRLPKSIEVKIS